MDYSRHIGYSNIEAKDRHTLDSKQTEDFAFVKRVPQSSASDSFFSLQLVTMDGDKQSKRRHDQIQLFARQQP